MNSAKCGFCGATFRNRQGVRAHLRHCKTYLNRQRTPGRPARRPPIGRAYLGRVVPKADEPEAEVHNFEDGASYLSRTATPPQPPAAGASAIRAILAAREAERRKEAVEALKETRRQTIQRVKDRVISQWVSLRYQIPADTKAQALIEIERVLSGLPVVDLPESELVQIAEGIRDKFYGPVMQAQDGARHQEEQQRQQERERATRVAEQQLREALGRQKTEARLSELLSYGVDAASRALQEVEGLDRGERAMILERVKRALADELSGEESKRDVTTLVKQFLDEALGEVEVDDEQDSDDEGEDDDEEDFEEEDAEYGEDDEDPEAYEEEEDDD